MGTLPTRQEILAGQPQTAEPIDENFQAVWTVLTNGIDSNNISTGGVHTDELATDAVTTAKIDDLAVTYAKLADDTKNKTAGTPSLRKLGLASTDAAAGNHDHTNHLIPMVCINQTSMTTTTQGYQGAQGSTRACSHTISGRKGYHRYLAIEFNMYVQTNGNAGGAALNKTYNDQSNQLGTVTYSSTGAGLKKILLDLDSVALHSSWTVYLQLWNTDGSTSTYVRPQNIYWVDNNTTIAPDTTAVY